MTQSEHEIKQYKTYVAPWREPERAELAPVDAPYSVGDIIHSGGHTGHRAKTMTLWALQKLR